MVTRTIAKPGIYLLPPPSATSLESSTALHPGDTSGADSSVVCIVALSHPKEDSGAHPSHKKLASRMQGWAQDELLLSSHNTNEPQNTIMSTAIDGRTGCC